MAGKKLLVDDNKRLCQTSLLGVICKVSNTKTSGETFCFLEKRLLSIFTFLASSNPVIVFLRAADWTQPTFKECIVTLL